jgi:hypothetical protein
MSVWPALVDSDTGRVSRPAMEFFAPGQVTVTNNTGHGTWNVCS